LRSCRHTTSGPVADNHGNSFGSRARTKFTFHVATRTKAGCRSRPPPEIGYRTPSDFQYASSTTESKTMIGSAGNAVWSVVVLLLSGHQRVDLLESVTERTGAMRAARSAAVNSTSSGL